MKCTLPENINKCPFFDIDFGTCNNGNKCSYQQEDKSEVKEKYIRKERWYEKYYK